MTTVERMKLNRLFQIRDEQKALQAEKMELIKHFGYGTRRSADYPGMKLMIQRAGWSSGVSWLYVARDFAHRLKWSNDKLQSFAERHRSRTRHNKRVAFSVDTAKNPVVLPI
ncbi:MAG: hypothetical protein V3R57_07765 [Candidatus Bathyarchaeia archaeon]